MSSKIVRTFVFWSEDANDDNIITAATKSKKLTMYSGGREGDVKRVTLRIER